jgi:hypothetical protein
MAALPVLEGPEEVATQPQTPVHLLGPTELPIVVVVVVVADTPVLPQRLQLAAATAAPASSSFATGPDACSVPDLGHGAMRTWHAIALPPVFLPPCGLATIPA